LVIGLIPFFVIQRIPHHVLLYLSRSAPIGQNLRKLDVIFIGGCARGEQEGIEKCVERVWRGRGRGIDAKESRDKEFYWHDRLVRVRWVLVGKAFIRTSGSQRNWR
jgi:hypothetical protein